MYYIEFIAYGTVIKHIKSEAYILFFENSHKNSTCQTFYCVTANVIKIKSIIKIC